ncbi:MAG TPA: VWA domain-containing protein [Pyrinomonadaceae bacterium]|nr:VWA domain-containing protein [Pyrinomonadaceae bacterium]
MAHKKLFVVVRACALFSLLVAFGPLLTSAQAQQPQEPAGQDDDVIRISTDLVQTDVTVFDKQGRFVDNLQRDQFELKVDGKPVQVSFFDKVTAGTADEAARLAAARGGAGGTTAGTTAEAPKPPDRGRIIFFFLDDTHMAADSVTRARKTLLEFIDKEMGQNDMVAIASATGQIGFLQQLTNNKAVLRAAVERLNYRSFEVKDMERPPMNVFQALEINEKANQELLNFFVEQLARELPQLPRDRLEQMIRDRADGLIRQSAAVTTNLLASLESLARSAGPLPGRKLVFFISDGFYLTNRVESVTDKLRRITDAAARTGVVIYSMDARGLVTGMPDASVSMTGDPTGIVMTTGVRETTASQEPLRTLAADTGGRALLNSNSLGRGVETALQETSTYYLLAWRPEGEAKGSSSKFRRIEASIKGRPELTVRVRRGFFDVEPEADAKARNKSAQNASNPAAAPEEEALRKALGAMYPKTDLPTTLALSYMDVQSVGPVVTAMMQVGGEVPEKTAGADTPSVVDVVGVLYDADGKPVSNFRQRLSASENSQTAPAGGAPAPRRRIVYTGQFRAAPGLHQVRVSARDAKSGRTGSAMQWIEVPDLSKHKLAMSGLLLGEAKKGAAGAATEAASAAESADLAKALLSADRRFARTSKLRFLAFIYNAARGQDGATPPDVAIQVQIIRDDKPVVTTALRKVTPGTDLTRIPYAAELPLEGLTPGLYELKLTAIDRLGKSGTSQRAAFEIE